MGRRRRRKRRARTEDTAPAVIDAPARDDLVTWRPTVMWVTPDGECVIKPDGFAGRPGLRVRDAFDRMAAQARRRGGEAIPAHLVGVGRWYRALTERHEAAGVRCASLEGRVSGGGDHAGWIASVLRDRDALAAVHRRIGDGVAVPLRRIRPSIRGTRSSITDRQLVDGVCLADLTISELLTRHGWARSPEAIRAARTALIEALERMLGAGQTMGY